MSLVPALPPPSSHRPTGHFGPPQGIHGDRGGLGGGGYGGGRLSPSRGPLPVSNGTAVPAVPADDDEWNSLHRWERSTRTIAHYQRLEQIGEGTYGQVYRARCVDTGRIVALKKISIHHGGYWGMPPTVLREIKILKRLQHPCLVRMLEVVSSKGVEHLDEDDERQERKKKENDSSKSCKKKHDRIVDAREGYKGNLFLVLEYVSHDLTGLMDVAYRFSEVQVKCIFRQLLEALAYMHEQKYVHRDIKSSNILIDSHFRVKLADFGLARCIEPPILDSIHDRRSSQEFTNKVITLWYRPPEILLGATRYGPPVDVWSAGCILAELLLGRPLFTGKTEMDQLKLIFDLLGTPTSDSWDGFTDLKLMRTGEVTIEKHRKPKLRERYGSKINGPALNLLEKLLELDPAKRLTAERALQSRYFLAEPRVPDRPEDLGPLKLGDGDGHFHEFQTKKKRREVKAVALKAQEEARARGMSEKDSEAEFDAVYRDLMKKVAKEGNAALVVNSNKKEEESSYEKKDDVDRKQRDESRRDKPDRKRRRDGETPSKDVDRHEKDNRRRSRDKDRTEDKEGRRRDKDRDRSRDRSKEEDRKKKRRREDRPEDDRVTKDKRREEPKKESVDEKEGERRVSKEEHRSVGSDRRDVNLEEPSSVADEASRRAPKEERPDLTEGDRRPVKAKVEESVEGARLITAALSDLKSQGSGERRRPRSEDKARAEVGEKRERRRDRKGREDDRERRDRRKARDRDRDRDRDRRRDSSRRDDRHRGDKDQRNRDGRDDRSRDRKGSEYDRGRDRGRDHDRHRMPPQGRGGTPDRGGPPYRGGWSPAKGGDDWGQPPREVGGDWGPPPQRGDDWGGRPRGDYGPPPPRHGPAGRGNWGPGPPPPNEPWRGPSSGPPSGYRGGERERRRDAERGPRGDRPRGDRPRGDRDPDRRRPRDRR